MPSKRSHLSSRMQEHQRMMVEFQGAMLEQEIHAWNRTGVNHLRNNLNAAARSSAALRCLRSAYCFWCVGKTLPATQDNVENAVIPALKQVHTCLFPQSNWDFTARSVTFRVPPSFLGA